MGIKFSNLLRIFTRSYFIILYAMIQPMLYCGPGNTNNILLIQPDKSKLLAHLFGDEYKSRLETLDGYTILKGKDNWYTYAIIDSNSKVMPSEVIVHDVINRDVNENIFLRTISKHINSIDKAVIDSKFQNNNYSFETLTKQNNLSVAAGIRKVLVVLVQFPDLLAVESKQSFYDMMNKKNWDGGIGSPGSANDYFNENSYGKFGIDAEVVGWYTAPQNHNYYSWSNSDNWGRSLELTKFALNSAVANGIDLSKFDNDGDGIIENIIIVHSGKGAAESGDTEFIWPHTYWPAPFIINGMKINQYAMLEELQYGRHSGIGMFVHEFGHMLGLPDLYSSSSSGIGDWCVMANGEWCKWGICPSHYCAWAKIKLGWNNTSVITQRNNYITSPAEINSTVLKILCNNSTKEYFLLEQKNKQGFDSYLPGSGLLVWHIDETITTANTNASHKLVSLEEADGFYNLDKNENSGDAGDVFPGSYNKTVFNTYSVPNNNKYDGNFTTFSLTGIAQEQSIIKFNIDFYSSTPSQIQLQSPANGKINQPTSTNFVWNKSIGGLIYDILIGDEASLNHIVYRDTLIIDSLKLFNGLVSNKKYFWKVRSKNPFGWGSWSNVWEFTTTQMDPGSIPQNGLVLYLPFSGNELDYSASLNNGIISNVALSSDRFNQSNSAYYFNGSNSFLTTTKIVTNPYPVNISLWFLTSSTKGGWLIGFGQNQYGLSNTHDRNLYMTNDGKLIWGVWSGNRDYLKTLESFNDGKWHHIIASIQNNGMYLYVDGKLNTSNNAYRVAENFSGYWKIGYESLDYWPETPSSFYFNGTLDDIRIYNRELSNEEISLLFNESTVTSVTPSSTIIPDDYSLFQNYPNPFNPTTIIRFSIPSRSMANIKIYDLMGREIRTLINEELSPGNYEINFDGSELASGIYFYKLQTAINSITKKMILMK